MTQYSLNHFTDWPAAKLPYHHILYLRYSVIVLQFTVFIVGILCSVPIGFIYHLCSLFCTKSRRRNACNSVLSLHVTRVIVLFHSHRLNAGVHG
jgi:hypothetical protein